jgi:hypothetical protein
MRSDELAHHFPQFVIRDFTFTSPSLHVCVENWNLRMAYLIVMSSSSWNKSKIKNQNSQAKGDFFNSLVWTLYHSFEPRQGDRRGGRLRIESYRTKFAGKGLRLVKFVLQGKRELSLVSTTANTRKCSSISVLPKFVRNCNSTLAGLKLEVGLTKSSQRISMHCEVLFQTSIPDFQ